VQATLVTRRLRQAGWFERALERSRTIDASAGSKFWFNLNWVSPTPTPYSLPNYGCQSFNPHYSLKFTNNQATPECGGNNVAELRHSNKAVLVLNRAWPMNRDSHEDFELAASAVKISAF